MSQIFEEFYDSKELDNELIIKNNNNYEMYTSNDNIELNNGLLIDYGYHESKGIRNTMEDAMIYEANFRVKNSIATSDTLSIFGIFDGHGGSECSLYCQKHFGLILRKMLKKYNDINTVLNKTVATLDTNFGKYEETIDESLQGSGSTLCVLIIDNKSHDAWVINVGDSRCVRIFDMSYEQLSVEHKPCIENELKRIKNAGGFVSRGYLMNMLGVSRSIGDIPFKLYWNNILISKPDIKHIKLDSNDKYILLGCDGLFDVFTNKDIMKHIIKRSNNCESLNKLCGNICKQAINVRKSSDNVSVILIKPTLIVNKAVKMGRFTVSFASDIDSNSESDSGTDNDIDTELSTNHLSISHTKLTDNDSDSDNDDAYENMKINNNTSN